MEAERILITLAQFEVYSDRLLGPCIKFWAAKKFNLASTRTFVLHNLSSHTILELRVKLCK